MAILTGVGYTAAIRYYVLSGMIFIVWVSLTMLALALVYNWLEFLPDTWSGIGWLWAALIGTLLLFGIVGGTYWWDFEHYLGRLTGYR